jgi:PST family polysaccharide transporter
MSLAKSKSSVLTGASWYLLEKLTRLVGAFLIGAWVARYLGPGNYGALAYALALVALLGFLGSWGIESLVVRDLAHDCIDPRRIISTYFFIRLGGALMVPALAVGYLALTHNDDRLLMFLMILCSGTVILGAFDIADCWLQAKHQAKASSLIRLVGFLAGAGIKCLFIVLGASVVWFAVAILLETTVIAILYFQLLRHHGLVPSIAQLSFVDFRRIIADGKVMALSALTVVVYSKIDVLVIGALFTREALGSYSIAASMCAAWNMVGMSLVQACAPYISLSMAESREHYINSLRNMFLIGLGISIAGCIFLSLFAGYIFDLLLGMDYVSAVPVFRVLVWSSVFVFLGVSTSQIIVNEKIYWVSLFRTSIGAFVGLVAIAPVAMTWGVVGVAWLVVVNSAVVISSILFSKSARSTIGKVAVLIPGFKK